MAFRQGGIDACPSSRNATEGVPYRMNRNDITVIFAKTYQAFGVPPARR